MSLARNGDLYELLKKIGCFDEEVTRHYVAELIHALNHLHSMGIVHRDVKPENILLSEKMHILLTDFGSAKILREDYRGFGHELAHRRRLSFVGTAEYVAPEVITEGGDATEGVTIGCDLWAAGCIVFQLLAGLPPFRQEPNLGLIFHRVKNADYSFPDGFNSTAKDLVQKLLRVHPKDRLGFSDPSDLRGHDFFAGIDWDTLTDSTPPDILPFLPATPDNEAIHSNYKIGLNMDVEPDGKGGYRLPDNVQPGLGKEQISRILNFHFHEESQNPSADMKTEAKNFKTFFVHTPNRTYYLIDYTSNALSWCRDIDVVRDFYFQTSATSTSSTSTS